jgi:hypothetical protein
MIYLEFFKISLIRKILFRKVQTAGSEKTAKFLNAPDTENVS